MAELTPDRLQELRRIAEAATPGPWWVDGWEARTKDGDLFIASIAPAFQGASPDASCWEVDANIQHIAAFDPPTVLALLDEIERLRRERETLAAAVRAWDDYAKTVSKDGPLAFYDALDALEEAERAMERAEQRHREALALLEGGGGA